MRRTNVDGCSSTLRCRAPCTCAVPIIVLAACSFASPASADVARLEVSPTGDGRAPTTVRIVVTPTTGSARTLGPFTTKGVPGGLVASPDGRRLLVLPYDDGNGGGVPLVVPVAGGPAVPLAIPAGIELGRPVSVASWSPDGDEVVVGDAIRVPPETDGDVEFTGEDRTTVSDAVLRCPVATLVCTEVPGPTGSAVGVPGGVLVSSSSYSLLRADYLFAGIGDEPVPDWAAPSSPWGRLFRGVHGDQHEAITRIEGPGARVVGRFADRAADGLPYTRGTGRDGVDARRRRVAARTSAGRGGVPARRLRARDAERCRLRAMGGEPRRAPAGARTGDHAPRPAGRWRSAAGRRGRGRCRLVTAPPAPIGGGRSNLGHTVPGIDRAPPKTVARWPGAAEPRPHGARR